MNALAQRAIAHANEAPRLHQSDAGRKMSGRQQPIEQLRVERIAQEMPHIAPGAHDPVQGIDLFAGKIRHRMC